MDWIRRILLFCIIGWIGGVAWGRPAPQGFTFTTPVKSVKIPVKIQHNIILLPVRVNQTLNMNFILDTGVKTTILTESVLASFLRLDSMRTIKVRGLGQGEAIEARLARNVAMSLPGGVEGRGMRMLVLPEDYISYSGMFGQPVHGIIGFDVFGQFVVEINYQHKYIRLHDPFSYKPKRKAQAIPLKIERSKPYVFASLTDYSGENIEERWLVDTGASNAVIMFNDDQAVPKPSIRAFLGRGLSGNVYGELGRAREFRLGEFVFPDLIAGYPDSTSLSLLPDNLNWYGNIGAEILSRFTVTFDYPHRVMYLKKNHRYKESFEYNISGLEVITSGFEFDRYLISYVRPNSPADLAGVKVNDEIISMNGNSSAEMNINQVYGTLTSRHGRVLNLRIRRDGKTLRKRFKLISEI